MASTRSRTNSATSRRGASSAPDAPRGNVVLHFHGGGYLIGSAKGSLEYASRLAAAVDGTCYTVDYRLAPEHPYPAAIDDAVMRLSRAAGARHSRKLDPRLRRVRPAAVSRWRWCWRCATPAIRLPAAIFAVAPFTDLTLSGPSVRAFNGNDPAANRDLLTFMGASYFQGHEPTDPLVSPLFGDLAGLPPLFVTATQGEVLLERHHAPCRAGGEGRRRRDAAHRRGFRARLHDLPVPAGDEKHDGGGRRLGAAQPAPQRHEDRRPPE